MMLVMVFSLVGSVQPETVNAASKKYVKSLTVSKSSVTLTSGKSTTVKATVKVNGSAKKTIKVVQTAATKKVVSVKTGSVNSKGVTKITLTAKSVTKKTTATLKIRTKAKNKKGAYITKKLKVTVNPAETAATETGTTTVAVTGVSATISSSTINVGETAVVTASVAPSNATDKSVTYTSSNTAVAMVSSTGTVVGVGAGTAIILVATSNGKNAWVSVTVTAQPTGITASISKSAINVGETASVTASVAPSNATDKSVTYTSSDTAVATVSGTGTVTGVGAGTAVITVATSNGKTASVSITVVAVPTGITVSISESTIDVGEETTVTADITPSNAADKSVTYTSSDTAVATVSDTGTVTGVGAGTAEITATTSNGLSESVSVTVIAVPTAISATVSSSEISIGESAVITAVITPQEAEDLSVTYASADSSVAAVDSEGTVVGIGAGTTTITVTTSNGLTATVDITVYSVAVSTVTLDQSAVTMTITGTVQLKATCAPSNATDQTITWTSSDQTVATVSSDGIVTGVSAGTATITAAATSGAFATCTVTVTSASVLTDGLTLEVTNPYTDGDGNIYANTVLIGNDMTIRVRVISDGAALGNASVTLTMAAQYGNAENDFEVRNSTQTTDANGYATFVVGLKSTASHTAVDGTYQSFQVTARESGSNASETILIKFASVSLNGITVENGNGVYADIVPSDNADEDYEGIEESYYIDSTKTEQFVSSQQVSSFDDDGNRVDDHRVYLSAAPYLILPATEDTAHTGNWVSEEVDADNSVSIYNDSTNMTVTSQSFSIPAGLQYLTLQLNSLSLSKYTRMSVTIYDASTGDLLYNVNYGYISNDSPSLQVSQQTDSESYLVVTIVSEGQISTSGSTCVLAGLTGVWVSSGSEQYTEQEIEGSVTWEMMDSPGYESQAITYDTASVYLPSDSTYLSTDYNYSVKIPAFPSTGDAQIVVKDSANTKTLAIYLYPVVNSGSNINTLSSTATGKAILASTEEASQAVGTLETDGNLAIVDATATGSTMLKATVDVEGLTTSELDTTNGAVLYTSIQWAPIPNEEEEAVYPDYFAIEGQQITVTAQLYDKNGNIKTTSGEEITFSADNTDEGTFSQGTTVGGDADGNGKVQVVSISNNGSTDTNGIVTLIVQSLTSESGYTALLEGLTATSTNYKVKLSVVNDATEATSEKCNLYWVDLGLTFVNSAYTYDTDGTDQTRTTVFANSTKTIEDKAYYTVSDTTGWKVGYQVVASCAKFTYNYLTGDEDETEYVTIPSTGVSEFISVSGVGIVYSHDEIDTVGFTQKDDMVEISSTKTCTDVIKGTISVTSSADVIFTFYDENGELCTCANVGSNEYFELVKSTGLSLTTVWQPSGLKAECYVPGSGTVNANQESKVFIKVLDTYGNLLSDATVTYSISGVNSTEDSQNAKEVTDSEGKIIDGVFVIELAAPEASGTCNITYSVNNGTYPGSTTLNYIDNEEKSDFTISNFKVSDDLQTVTVYFSNAVNSASIYANEFTFCEGDTQITVTNAELVSGSSSAVALTLETPISSTSSTCILSVKTYTDKTGIEYSLVDEYGQMITTEDNISDSFIPSELN